MEVEKNLHVFGAVLTLFKSLEIYLDYLDYYGAGCRSNQCQNSDYWSSVYCL